MTRLFLGIAAPAAAHEFCCRPVADLDGLRTTRPARLHLTLHFLGELTNDMQLRLQQQLTRLSAPRFPLTLQGRGYFHPSAKNGVLWVGVRMSSELQDLHTRTASAMTAVGLQPESREWKPHVTIARFNRDQFSAEAVEEFLRGQTDESITFEVDSCTLYDSSVSSNSDEYRILQTYALQ